MFEIDAELARIDGVERVLRVDEAANAAPLLRLGDDMERERGLARGLRPINLDDAAARQAADAERDVETERARRDGLDTERLLVMAETHDGALAEAALDLGDRRFKGLFSIHLISFDEAQHGIRHGKVSVISQGSSESQFRGSARTLAQEVIQPSLRLGSRARCELS